MVMVEAVTPGPLNVPVSLLGGAIVAPVEPPVPLDPVVVLLVDVGVFDDEQAARERVAIPARQATAAPRLVKFTVGSP